jgi:hypothetical protein
MRPIIQSAFELKATSAAEWGLQARLFKRSGDVLFARFSDDAGRLVREEAIATELDDLQLQIPASFLYGLALENLFKAIIIHQRKPATASDVFALFGKGSLAHNLNHHAKTAAFARSKDELDLLNRLSAHVEWAGRYPIPKKVEKMTLLQKAVTGEWLPLPLQQYEVGLYEAVFARADRIIFF